MFHTPSEDYYYKEPAKLNSSKMYSWLALIFPHSTMSIVVYTLSYHVFTYFAGNFDQFNVHVKVFCWILTVYPIVTLLTGLQVANLGPYLSKVLPHILSIYTHGWYSVPFLGETGCCNTPSYCIKHRRIFLSNNKWFTLNYSNFLISQWLSTLNVSSIFQILSL